MKTQLFVNLSMVGTQSTGLGVYAQQCANYLDRKLHCTFIASSNSNLLDESNNPVLTSPPEITIGYDRWAGFRRMLYRGPAIKEGLMYCPAHFGFSNAQDQILTILDLICLHYPQQHWLQYLSFRWLLPTRLRQCRAIFTISETTKKDLVASYGLPSDKIFVVPCAIDHTVFYPSVQPTVEDYLLVVGASYRHKNIEELLEQWPLWKGRYRLKITSVRGKHKIRLQTLVNQLGLSNVVDMIEYLPMAQLVQLYQRCQALVYPSLWEGFGIPPLEAMACGRPALVSDIPVHQEILGDAPLYITPGQPHTWQRAFAQLADADLVQHHCDRGLALAQNYTWERTGERLLQALFAVDPSLTSLQRT